MVDKGVAFGKCLNSLLIARGWSAARLAREISLDASYIRRWINGDRVPSLKSGYIEQIASCLCAGTVGTSLSNYKENYIISLETLGFQLQKDKDIKEIVKDALSSSQIYSLKFHPRERALMSVTTEDDVVSLLEGISRGKRNVQKTADSFKQVYNLSTIPAVIKGRESILHAHMALINAALEYQGPKKGEIMVTFQSGSYYFDGYPELGRYWLNQISDILTDGWKVLHLIRLDRNVTRSIKLVKRILEQIGFDRQYYPLYFEKYGTTSPASEVLIVEGVGALLCFSAEDPEYIDTAFFYTQPAAIQSLHKYYRQMFEHLHPLMKAISLDEYFDFNTETSKKHGDRLTIRNDLDTLTIPYSLWTKYLERTIIDEDERVPHLDRIKAQRDIFSEQVQRYRFMNICSTEAVEHLIKHKRYLYDNVYRIPTTDDIIEHLENTIHLLKEYKNFEIGLLSDDQKNLLSPVYWEVKGDYSVIIDMWHPEEVRDNMEERGMFLAITESTIAGSFREHFFDVWERISPKYRDKEFVINWFEDKLEWFKGENM